MTGLYPDYKTWSGVTHGSRTVRDLIYFKKTTFHTCAPGQTVIQGLLGTRQLFPWQFFHDMLEEGVVTHRCRYEPQKVGGVDQKFRRAVSYHPLHSFGCFRHWDHHSLHTDTKNLKSSPSTPSGSVPHGVLWLWLEIPPGRLLEELFLVNFGGSSFSTGTASLSKTHILSFHLSLVVCI